MKAFRKSCPVIFLLIGLYGQAQELGVFESHGDVGNVLHKGSVAYDSPSGRYTISGSGANIWFTKDEFHYAWKKLRGNFILQARVAFVGEGKDAHRKIGWMVRNSLDTAASMVSATVHGDGLTSLQYRKTPLTNIEERRSQVKGPDIVQLERRGTKFILSVARSGEPFQTEEVADALSEDVVYAGLFVCSHNKDVVETANFDNVRIIIPAKENFIPYKDYIGSNIEILDIKEGTRRIVYSENSSLQAPNWTKDGSLIYNNKGLIYLLRLGTDKPVLLNTGGVTKNNNDHVLSFDGKMLGLSAASLDGKYNSVVYTVPVKGGIPKQITPVGPSYLHGWSPDGKWLTFTAQRNKDFNIYKIPAKGGKEIQLTTASGLDDGSEYSPDGKYIYFNSVRSGTMQLWRMKADGSEQTQITSDGYNNWFPHISPDAKWIVFLSFMSDVNADDHPFYKHVYIRMMPAKGGDPKVIAYLYGGQGSINTPSWSPDSRKISFVSNSD